MLKQLTAFLAIAVLLVSACQSSTSPAPSSPAGSTPAGSATATVAATAGSSSAVNCATPQTGGTFIYAAQDDPPTLTFLGPTGTLTSALVLPNIMSQLVGLDFQFKPTPDLADSWEVSTDGLSYTFHLNPNAKWSDGVPVTSADVVWNLQITWPKSSRWGTWGNNIESMTATDDHTVVMKLKTPYAPMFNILGDLNAETFIYPKHIYEKDGTDYDAMAKDPVNQKPVGSGPFMFKEWVKGDHITLVRNPNYFKTGKPYLDQLIFKILPDDSARTLAFENGDVDFLYTYEVPLDHVDAYAANPKFQVIHKGLEAASTVQLLQMNLRNQYLSKPAVRQAIAYALNKQDIADKSQFKQATVAHSIIGSGVTTFFTPKYDTYTYDAAKANSLLDQAGFPKGSAGTRFKIRITYPSGLPAQENAVQVIKSNLADVGIDLQLVTSDEASVNNLVYTAHDFDLSLQQRTTGSDPTMSIPRVYSKAFQGAGLANAMGYSNDALETIFATEYKEIDPAKRMALWDQAQQIAMTDLPVIPLFEVPDVQVAAAKFCNVIGGPVGYLGTREQTFIAPGQ